jgi:GNAT superfamily N-acetyltransferase
MRTPSESDRVHLRVAGAADGAAIARIKLATWNAAYRGLLPDGVLDALDAGREAAEWGAYAAAAPPGERLRIAQLGDAIVGYARTEPSPDPDAAGAGEVAGLYVDVPWWGRGIGRVLLADAVAGLRAAGHDEIVLWHFVGNARARRTYAAAGFAPDGARRPVPECGVDEVRLRLRG